MLNETKHTFSGNPRFVKKRIIPLLNKAGIRRLKVKEYGDTKLDVQFDANNEEFGILKDLLKKDLGKEGGFKWKQANLELEGIEKEIQEELKLKKKLKEMIRREKKMKIMKSKLKEIIREVINEQRWMNENPPLEGDVFKAMWEKALKYAKSAGIWSPHIAQSNKTDPVGKYNRDFWDSFRSKGDDVVTFGYHLDSASYAFKNGIWVKDLYLLWGTAATKDDLEGNLSDGKKIVKALNKAGFKAYLSNSKSAIKLSARFTAKSL